MRTGRWIETIVSHDKSVTIVVLCAVSLVSWIYLLAGSGTGMSTWAMTSWSMAIGAPEALASAIATPIAWTPAYAATMFIMWWVMMIAMMLPSAAPVILLFARISAGTRNAQRHDRSDLPVAAFVAGYLLVWGVFSGLAVLLQWWLKSLGLLSPATMSTSSAAFAGVVLVYAGIYQVSPLKRFCLKHCQGPLAFVSRHWRSGTGGALRMGLRHGMFCLGCCLGLMAILFFGGIMNLYWIGGLALVVLLEKILPFGQKLAYLTGPALMLWGSTFLWRSMA